MHVKSTQRMAHASAASRVGDRGDRSQLRRPLLGPSGGEPSALRTCAQGRKLLLMLSSQGGVSGQERSDEQRRAHG
jgi:hypothetical protein